MKFCQKTFLVAMLGVILVVSCQQPNSDQTSLTSARLFTSIPAKQSGVDFRNVLVETEQSNYYQYMYSYIGAGVATADFNRDGLIDLFFVSNQEKHQLFINRGDFQFEDVTEQSGISKRTGFDAGVAIADINADGFPDIYITRGGWIQEDNAFANMLYVNNGKVNAEGIPSFTERADELGLADDNRSIAASFFDYDRDGDVDVYVCNSPDFEDRAAEILDLSEVANDPKTLELKGSDKLFQNDGSGHFKDISTAAGIVKEIGFGLNPQVGDLNADGWLDIYVCNDFRIPDFVYLNNQDGSFREGRNELFKHMSFNSMGSDLADVNNDGLVDLYTLDMNPEDYIRSKTTMGMTSQSRFERMVELDYHHQYMHNMLQINNGNGTFREIAQLAGVANTDWSWSSLLADFDLDGFNDIFVTNGVYRDVIDRDANNRILAELRAKGRTPTKADFLRYTQMLPQQKMTNYFFKNRGDYTFDNMSSTWTDSVTTFSNGAAYADLDNDGDLDIIVSNINDEATLLRNNAIEQQKGSFLKIELAGPKNNRDGIGTAVRLFLSDSSILFRRYMPSRGFLSSMSGALHFGLSHTVSIKRLEAIWPDGLVQIIDDVDKNKTLSISYTNASSPPEDIPLTQHIFRPVPFDVSHVDPVKNDYAKQILLPHKLSQTGPALAVGDVNSDGLDDVYIGGAHSHAGQLIIGEKNGTNNFSVTSSKAFERDRQREDVGASFFDADGDGDQDLYVVSGSYEFTEGAKLLQDRLYLNDGQGDFTSGTHLLPQVASAGSVVRPADFDGDGDVDLFVGGRVIPGQYPYPPISYLLKNQSGSFVIANDELAPQLTRVGMVTDASWVDIDQDRDLDLVVTGEWMGIEVFVNQGGRLVKDEQYAGLDSVTGWWNKVLVADIDQDGDQDIVAGNLGLNYKFHASVEKPFHVYTNDFDYNGTVDVFLAKYYNEKEVPVRGKTCTAQQMPHLAQKIPTYNDFAVKDIAGIIGPGIESALHYTAIEFRSGIFLNNGSGEFSFQPFPQEVQQSLINSIVFEDIDGDQIGDLLMAGNNHLSEIETTRADAGIGILLKGAESGVFTPMSHLTTGFFANKDVRHIASLKGHNRNYVLVINNNDEHQLFEITSSVLQ